MSKEKVIIPSTKLKCDKCGEYFDDGEGGMCIPYDTDGSEIEECALEEGWIEKDGKHYCPKCKRYEQSRRASIESLSQRG